MKKFINQAEPETGKRIKKLFKKPHLIIFIPTIFL